MAVEKYAQATEYIAYQVTFTRGTTNDITNVGVYYNTDQGADPAVVDFIGVTLVEPGDPLGETGKVDVLALVGPKAGADLNLSTPGTYWSWVLIQTANEDIIEGPLGSVTII